MAGNSGDGVRERLSPELAFSLNADKTQGVGELGEPLCEIDDAAREPERAVAGLEDFNAARRGFEMESVLDIVLVRASKTPNEDEDLVVERRLDDCRSFCEFISDGPVLDFAVFLFKALKMSTVTVE